MTTTPFHHLLAAEYRRVHRAALGWMGEEQEAREAAQEALAKAYAARDRYDPERPFGPWLYRIVKHTCLDALARGRRRAVPGLDPERVVAPSAGDGVEDRERRERLSRALADLPAEQREVVQLRHFEDQSYAEIAATLQIPEGTVMSRLYRARKALAARLEDE